MRMLAEHADDDKKLLFKFHWPKLIPYRSIKIDKVIACQVSDNWYDLRPA